ncbi:MAG: hypothetical protein ACRDQT_05030 [Gaiellaceae bacterium]
MSRVAAIVVSTFALTGGVLGIACGPALAHFDASGRYTHRSCPASAATRVDPINVVFTGWGTWGRADSQISSHAGWSDGSGTTQSFVDHGGCFPKHAQRASGRGSRFHVRVRGQHPDPALGWTATAGAHHEDLVLFPIPCGHAVDSNGAGGSGFDQGRNELERRFSEAGHPTHRLWWGNTQSFKQCDGDYAASDGWTVFVELHQVNH